VTKCLKNPLCRSLKGNPTSWRLNGFIKDENSAFGAGTLSLTVGRFGLGHTVCISKVCGAGTLLRLKISGFKMLYTPQKSFALKLFVNGFNLSALLSSF
jgi:hypothetical protein